MNKRFPIQIDIERQPDDCTCGPTCLHAVYQYFEPQVSLENVIEEVRSLEDGGTLAVFLGLHALSRGYAARIISYNLKTLDPTWANLSSDELILKLDQQAAVKSSKKLQLQSKAYIEFLKNGGEFCFEPLGEDLLQQYFERKIPVLSGLSATYLYGSKREYTEGKVVHFDDVKGVPMGHFVVLCGMDRDRVAIADPYSSNPHGKHYYLVDVQHLIHSVLLGIVTYDANLLIVAPREKGLP